MVHLNN